jgi:hypothetical protein
MNCPDADVLCPCGKPGKFRCGKCLGGISYCSQGCFALAWTDHRKCCARLAFPPRTPKYEFQPRRSHEPAGTFLIRDHQFKLFLCEASDGDDCINAADLSDIQASEASARATSITIDKPLITQMSREWVFIASDNGLLSGTYKLSSGLFAQAISRLYMGQPLDRFAFGSEGVWAALSKTIMMDAGEFLQRACLTTRDPLYARMPHYTTHTRQWLYGPDRKKQYLGMGVEGPTRLTVEGWALEAARGLRQDAVSQSSERGRTTMVETATILEDPAQWTLWVDGPPPPIPE